MHRASYNRNGKAPRSGYRMRRLHTPDNEDKLTYSYSGAQLFHKGFLEDPSFKRFLDKLKKSNSDQDQNLYNRIMLEGS